MKRFLLISLLCILPMISYADGGGFDDFRLYKKPLLKGIEIAQTETHTDLFYNRILIKSYVNAEFATELLPHWPNEDPDCYNSLHNTIPSNRTKDIIGREYLRSCLVLQTQLIRGRYILFLGPSTDGNRISIYDIRAKKFSHAIINNALSFQTTRDGNLIAFVRNIGSPCERSILLYKWGVITFLFDECTFQDHGGAAIRIDSFKIRNHNIDISYTPYTEDATGNIVLTPSQKSKKTISF